MAMQFLRDGASGGFLKYILLGLLGMSVAGLVVMDVTGSYSAGGLGGSDVAKVEGKTITIQEFDRTVRRALSRYNLPVEQAYSLGMIDEILTRQIRSTFLALEAEDLGIKVGKDVIAKNIAEIVKPQMTEGESLQDALDRLLRYQQISESALMKNVEADATANIISETLQEAFSPSQENLARIMNQFQNQTRNIEFIVFEDKNITDYEQPTESQISALYESVKDIQFKTPEYRTGKAVIFDSKRFEVDAEVTEDESSKHYKDNRENYALGEQYVVTQLITADEEDAKKIYEQVTSGKNLKDIAASEIGKKGQYAEKIPFEIEMMLPEFREALFNTEINEFAPPFKTIMGYHIAQLNDVLEPKIPDYEEIKDVIKQQILSDKKADALYEVIASVDTEISDGLSYEDAVQKYEGAQIVEIGQTDINGKNTQQEDTLPTELNQKNAETVLQTMFENEKGIPSPLVELREGKFASILMTDRIEQGYRPLDEVRDSVKQQFISDIQNAENEDRVRKILAETDTTAITLGEISKEKSIPLQSLADITLNTALAAPLKKDNIPVIFKALPNDIEIIEVNGGYALFSMTEYDIPDSKDNNAETEQIKASLTEEAQNEAMLLYLKHLGSKYDAQINKALLDQVYGKPRGN